ncbi:MAG: hypothetical protein VZQ80_09065 [Lachnospiraceae bacterium]|nr:hypothetical protein [Lachnospiraceae bacterium]
MKYKDVPLDANGYPFERPSFWLEPQEYGKIISEINALYNSQYKGSQYCAHLSFGIDGVGYVYFFENHGFNNYNIYQRVVDNR